MQVCMCAPHWYRGERVKLCGLSHWGCQTRWSVLAVKSIRQWNLTYTPAQHWLSIYKIAVHNDKVRKIKVRERWTTAFHIFNKTCTNAWHTWGFVAAWLPRHKNDVCVVINYFQRYRKKNKLICIVFLIVFWGISNFYLPEQLNTELHCQIPIYLVLTLPTC